MEKIDLKEHKELFKILPEQEYSTLEKALEKGLFLTSQAVEGQGERLFENETLKMSLPMLYDNFKKIGDLKKKQKSMVLRDRSFKDCLDLDDFSSDSLFGIVATGFLSIFIPGAVITGTFIETNLLLSSIGCMIFVLGMIEPFISMETQEKYGRMYSATGLVTGAIRKTNDVIEKKRSAYLDGRLQKRRGIIKAGVMKVGYDKQLYEEKWMKKQEKELLQILENEEAQEFVKAYSEVEKRLVPLHKIELHKNIEQYLYKEWEKEKDLKKSTEKLIKAKKAGVILDSLEQDLKQEKDKKTEYHKNEIKELKELWEKI